jgi:DNA-binding Lrp family transcriptional regulator
MCTKVEAFILINTKPGALWKVVEEAKKIANVKVARPVSGRFDVVVFAETDNLSWIVSRIHSIKGIVKSETLVALGANFE